MAAFTEKQRKLTKKLITSLTGFRFKEENFKLCFLFCKSNFKYHRYLSVNDVDVRRKIDGLEEKFLVHSQPDKAHDLRRLTVSFLTSCLEDSYPHSDAHYGILLFLMCLSKSPLHAHYVPVQTTPTQPPEVDWFDWTAYLMEGIEYSSTESSGSEWSDSENGEGRMPLDLNDSAIEVDVPSKEVGVKEDAINSKLWLLENVSIPYWIKHFQTTGPPKQSPLAHPSCSLAEKWEDFLKMFGPVYKPTSDLFLKEWQIVRETIWLLLGAEQSFVFDVGEVVKVRPGIRVSHLTPVALSRLLEEFATCATKLRSMRRFCSDVLLGATARVKSRTYEAFASGLQCCLTKLLQATRTYEEDLVLKRRPVSLLRLKTDESLTFDLVDRLYCVFQEGVAMSPTESEALTPFHCSTKLLNTLWAWLESCDMLGPSGYPLVKLLLPLWLEAVRPYMDMLHSFITTGAIQDQHGEFYIIRNPNVYIEDSDYWDRVFITRGSATPTFLRLATDLVILSGKSRHLMEVISGRRDLSSRATTLLSQSYAAAELVRISPSTLYQDLLESVKEAPGGRSCDQSGDSGSDKPTACEESSATFPSQTRPLTSKGDSDRPSGGNQDDGKRESTSHYDGLVRVYLKQLDHIPPQDSSTEEVWSSQVEEIIEHPYRAMCYPLGMCIQHHISSHFKGHYQRVSQALVELLRSEFNVSAHIQVLQEFFLLRAGATAHHFTHHIFQRELDGEVWFSHSFLSAVLTEALHYTHSSKMDTTDALEKNLSLTPPTNPTLPPPSLCLHYAVPSPLNIVFTTSIMEGYNRIFQFLLHVRWAKWSLEMPMTRSYTATPTRRHVLQYKAHLLFLLRNKLLFFVNSLNTYLMTKIMDDVGVNIQHKISMATDLEGMIHEHSAYLQSQQDRCFLNKKVGMVQEAVVKTLNLGVKFRRTWERGVAHFDVAVAKHLEEEFVRCCHFLVSCLNSATRRGTFLHLEMLAFALQPLKTADKIFSEQNCALIERQLQS